MTFTTRCDECQHTFQLASRCPHCARPGLFPNVTLAEAEVERRAVDQRYGAALEAAKQRGSVETVRKFESRARHSQAVVTRSLHETMRLAAGDNQLYATYHQLTACELRVPEGSKWDLLRTLTDQTLFGTYKEEVRFAALSLDGCGLSRYGECSWILRDDMIAHRASVFEENSVMFMARENILIADADKLPAGHRATWAERAKLCVAKLAGRIESTAPEESFAKLLLKQGATPEEDEFVEVHIGGPMTIRTLQTISVAEKPRRRVFGRALRKQLKKLGVQVESAS